jgi:cytochrome P450
MLNPILNSARSTLARTVELAPRTAKPLADPPPGSGLEPVLGVQRLPYLGDGLGVLADPLGAARRRHAEFGPVSWGGFMGARGVWVASPDAIGEVLTNRDKAFANGPGWGYYIGPFFTRGIMLLDFQEHLQHRRIMQEAFTRDRLQNYLVTLNDGIALGIATWRPTEDFRLYDATKQLLLDLAAEVFMGAELGPEIDQLNKAFVDTVVGGLAAVRANVPGGRWHRGLVGRKVLEDYFYAQLPAKRAEQTDDLFSVLCHAETPEGERFTDEDVVNHMIFVLMAAHDTSTITLTTMAYYMAKHPEWQDKAREQSRSLSPEISYDTLDELTVLDRIMKESLRLNSPVPGLPRQAKEDTEICGHFIPKGTYVSAISLVSHHNPDLWNNPEHFDPDRFTKERAEDKAHRYAWMPFGGGVHKCIGLYFAQMEIKIMMHNMLLNYEWTVPKDYVWKLDNSTLPVPKDRLPVRVRAL